MAAALSCGVFFSVLGAAQTLPAEAAPATFEPSAPVEGVPHLAPVPELRLSLPALLSTVPARNEAAVGRWPAYWRDASVPSAWRDFTDAELRLEVETWGTQLGPLSISTRLVSTPERERKCHPHCQGQGWSSSLQLKHELGDIGPLRQTGSELELGVTPKAGAKAKGLDSPRTVDERVIWGGFSGKF